MGSVASPQLMIVGFNLIWGDMGKILRELVTESDNLTHDIYKWLALATVATAIGLTIYTVVHVGAAFDMQSFGLGMGGLFAGVGVQAGLRK